MKMVNPQGIKNEMDKGENPFHLVDVRGSDAYEHNHISGAISVPEGVPAALAKALNNDMDDVIVFYDDHEKKDAEVEAIAKKAEEYGFKNVYGMKGGMMAWMECCQLLEFGSES